jgi:DNA-binding transcriptional regulator YiaG
MQVNHKNGDKQDNRVENLEYVTCTENIRHGWATGLYAIERRQGEANSQAKLNAAAIRFIRQAHRHVSLGQLAAAFGVTQQAVAAVVKRQTWKHV